MRCLTVLVIAAASMQFELLYARPAVPEWLRFAPRNDREEVPSQGSDEDRLAMYAVNNAIIVDISTRAVGDFPDRTYVRHDRVDETVVGQLGGEAHLTHTHTNLQLSDVTIQFETGPNLRELEVAAVCTRRGCGGAQRAGSGRGGGGGGARGRGGKS